MPQLAQQNGRQRRQRSSHQRALEFIATAATELGMDSDSDFEPEISVTRPTTNRSSSTRIDNCRQSLPVNRRTSTARNRQSSATVTTGTTNQESSATVTAVTNPRQPGMRNRRSSATVTTGTTNQGSSATVTAVTNPRQPGMRNRRSSATVTTGTTNQGSSATVTAVANPRQPGTRNRQSSATVTTDTTNQGSSATVTAVTNPRQPGTINQRPSANDINPVLLSSTTPGTDIGRNRQSSATVTTDTTNQGSSATVTAVTNPRQPGMINQRPSANEINPVLLSSTTPGTDIGRNQQSSATVTTDTTNQGSSATVTAVTNPRQPGTINQRPSANEINPVLLSSTTPGTDIGAVGQSRYQTAGTPTVLFRTRDAEPTFTGEPPSSAATTNLNLLDLPGELNSGIIDNDPPNNIDDFLPEVPSLGDSGQTPCLVDLKEILKEHRANFIHIASEDPLLMEVRREFTLKDSLALIRYSQEDLHSPLQIKFSGEDGIDVGGLRREFWSLFLHQLTHSFYMTGKSDRLSFQSNYMEKKKNVYFHLGQLVALSILQDGPGLPLFSDVVTDYILAREVTILNPDDLTDFVKGTLDKMKECESEKELQDYYLQIFESAHDAGFILPASRFSKSHINILQAALIEFQVKGCKEELDQFITGLDTHQVLSVLRSDDNRPSARSLFSGRTKPVTANTLRNLLKFNYTDGNEKDMQRATGQGFLTFIQASKGTEATINGITLKPKDILMWLTGSTHIPAIGFHKTIDVEFGSATFVNTCALCLTLEVKPALSTEDAVPYYTSLIINSQTFCRE